MDRASGGPPSAPGAERPRELPLLHRLAHNDSHWELATLESRATNRLLWLVHQIAAAELKWVPVHVRREDAVPGRVGPGIEAVRFQCV
jgi:hypothetical protein